MVLPKILFGATKTMFMGTRKLGELRVSVSFLI